jgi:DNA-binding CsgD family transcriptional regulator
MNKRDSERVRRAIALACRATTDPATLFNRLSSLIRQAVPFDAACWETTDPATMLPTAGVTINLPEEAAPAYFENEYSHIDVNKFHDLALQDRPVARMSDATGGDLSRSRRYTQLYEPRGFEHELRAALVDGESCWGAVALIRSRGQPDFNDFELALVESVAAHIGRALRIAYLVSASGVDDDPDAPGVIVIDVDDRVESMTGAGETWLSQLRESAMTRGEGLPLPIQAIVAKFRGLSLSTANLAPSLRVRTRTGRWVTLHAAAMSGASPGAVAVVVQHARPVEIVPLMLSSYGLTQREAEVAQLALPGLPVKAIAGRLGISPYTTQDHLSVIYTKLEVPGRQELAARVFYDRYWPRLLGAEPATPTH